jgi:outer membrane beta-barrel protein
MYAHLKAPSLTLASLILIGLVSAPAFAQGQKSSSSQANQSQGQAGEKMDVSDLEKKYWSAKDTDFSVVQNRLFSKANRLALTLNYGMYVAEPWSKGGTYGLNLNYFFSERYGVELAYSKTDSSDNDATQNLKANQGGAPNHDKMKGYYGVGFNWVPFYAKMSFLNSSILYFDMSVTPGVGIMQYQEQKDDGNVDKTAPAVSLALTQHFFLTKWLALRIDYKNFWYNQDVVSYHVTNRTTSTNLQNESLLMGGFTFYY